MMLVYNWLAGVSAPMLFERWVIGSIENMIAFTINTRQHGVGREKN
jgi:hypothetical protein